VKVLYPEEDINWKRLYFNQLNCEEAEQISKYIKDTFSTPGKFTHLGPMLIASSNCFITLTVDVSQINEFIK
jgi:hypothetical protein